ncbi:MFS transporter [Petropleomorpha daqingensis]|uniref:EmrB/QacA subfamily drug resistance transporter n=1 Tax=Petropleomorpha daqingensis TaxID=2026353 RepID=A0A853C9T1_9ACTN|nr:EmrB/QacA subfamily drug resistance transporter [Petropleomorpha daqingensis]
MSDTTTEPVAATLPVPQAVRRGPLLVALLGATVLGTISNNIVNVPLRQITEDFAAPVTQGVLVASASVLVLAVAMPLTGWISDRLGRRRTLLLALSVLLVGTVGAAVAPTLGLLVVARALQGLGCAAVPVAVMGTLARTWPAAQRSRVMGTWGAANGVGQAIGPPIGGLVADAFGWRAIFVGLAPLTVAVLVVTWRAMPRDPAVRARIDGLGSGSLTVGVALLMSAITAAPQPGVPGWLAAAGVVLGLGSLAVFVLTSLRRSDPFIDPRLLVEVRWLRSATGVFVQQSSLAAVLVAVPLYLTGVIGVSASVTGLLVFALPLVWAVLAPLVGLLADRVGPRPVLRTGLGLLVAVDAGLAVALGAGVRHLLPLAALLVAAGVGIALVQTPALTGATRSPAGQRGAGLGLFNMMRFVGAAVGTAAVAAAWPDGLAWLFGGTAAVAALGLGISFVGREMPAA